MKSNRTLPFVALVVAAALTSTLALKLVHPAADAVTLTPVLVLGAFALVAELLAVVLPKDASASVAAFPAMALVILAPTWQTVVAVAVVKTCAECVRQREVEKGIFNIAQYALATSVGVWVFLNLGGQSMLSLQQSPVADLTRTIGISALAAFFAAMATNSILVSLVIASANGTSVGSVWRANTLATVGVEILSAPLIFVFAWVYARFGAIVAAAAWVPIIGIRNAQRTNVELARTNAELLELMVKSIEARDAYTSGHSRRVQHYSIAIARALHLSEKDVSSVGQAALLHDVGKIHEKYGPILRKSECLTNEEWATMKEHPADGANLIATMTRLRELVGDVRHHHENWDGSGYPDGLVGELIPLGARIIRFADTIDAMTTERPYRAAKTAEDVRAELLRCRGTQFDPQIVDRLLSSPAWRGMFAPTEPLPTRLGELVVLPMTKGQRARA